MVGAGIGQWLAVTAGHSLREVLRMGLLRAFDNVGGALLGAATGLVFVWFIGSILLYSPGIRASAGPFSDRTSRAP